MRLPKSILVIPLFCLTFGCSKESDVTNDPHYANVVGKEFITKVDAVAFSFSDSRNRINLDVPGTSSLPEKGEIKGPFPFDYYGDKILGILPAGTRFRIVGVRRRETFENSSIHYTATILNEGQFKDQVMVVTWLAEMTYYPNVPKFNPKYVEPVKGE